ncbi:hypothetical protein [Bremerella sp. P1]|uniref:hypothetical protein n=1 Tax=Bremerella sp. P1 TaxID=3026424 RepID=UPI0023679332|nr:hypothetical protein [Bremerella sp. P1]WDI41359.1 hypothetical protein PSR63_23095 [Bremerella sp. P1]
MLNSPLNLLAVALVALVAGCNSGGDDRFAPTVEVTGQVTYNGKPISAGEIQFTSAEDRQNGSETSVFIEQGKYSAMVTRGTKEVRIYAHKPVGAADETGSQAQKQYLPAKYNSNSELEVEVGDEAVTFDFDLKK